MEDKKVRTIFFGTGTFALKILQGILSMPLLDIKAVVTQPDKIAGRDKILTPSPVKKYINYNPDLKFKVYQPDKLKLEADMILKGIDPEFILVADYSQMIPESIIEYPKYKCLNVHGSLLPDLRGAVPTTTAILKGYTRTGVSIPIMSKGLDDGDIVASKELDILPTDTTYTLRMRLADIAVPLLEDTLPKWFRGEIEPIPQDHSKATYTYEKDIAKDNAKIDKDTNVELAERMIRAYIPWPVAWVEVKMNDKIKRVKIFEAEIVKGIILDTGGFRKYDKKLHLVLNDGILYVKKLQLEGKPIMHSQDALFLANIDIY